MGGGSSRCNGPRNDYNNAVNNRRNYGNLVGDYNRAINATVVRRTQKQAQISQMSREVNLLRARSNEMRESMRRGVVDLMERNKFVVDIPNDAQQKFAFLSYNDSYVVEL